MDALPPDRSNADLVLPDVTSLPLRELVAADDSVLANSVRRLVDELDDDGIVAGFSNRAG